MITLISLYSVLAVGVPPAVDTVDTASKMKDTIAAKVADSATKLTIVGTSTLDSAAIQNFLTIAGNIKKEIGEDSTSLGKFMIVIVDHEQSEKPKALMEIEPAVKVLKKEGLSPAQFVGLSRMIFQSYLALTVEREMGPAVGKMALEQMRESGVVEVSDADIAVVRGQLSRIEESGLFPKPEFSSQEQ